MMDKDEAPTATHAVSGGSSLRRAPEHGREWTGAARISAVAIAVVLSWFRVWEPLPRVDAIGLLAALLGGYPIFREAFAALLSKRMTMELSMTIAILAALGIGEFFTGLVIVLFVLIAEVLEGLTVRRGPRAIRDLLDCLPARTLVRRADDVREVALAEIRPGDIIIVKPGAPIPADGVVVTGHSFVDQSTITGESSPSRSSSAPACTLAPSISPGFSTFVPSASGATRPSARSSRPSKRRSNRGLRSRGPRIV